MSTVIGNLRVFLGLDSAQFQNGLQKSNSALGSWGKSAIAMAARVGAGVAAAFSAASVIRASDQYVEMTNGLRVLGMSATEAAERLSQIGDIAKRTRTPLEATAQLYQRVSLASKELGATQDEVLRFTENVGLALAQQGGSAAQASGALMQLSQALAGGVVRAEEFNSILEGAPAIAQTMANGIDKAGGSIGRLRQMMLDGEITSKMAFDAIISQTTRLSDAFADTVPTVGQAMQVFRDQWMLAVGQMASGTSMISEAILKAADGVATAAAFIQRNMNDIIGVIGAASTALTIAFVPAIYRAVAAVKVFGASLITLRGAMIATGIGALVVSAGLLVGRLLDLRQATGSWGAAFEAMGELAQMVFQGIIDSGAAIGPGLGAIWSAARADFYAFISDIQNAWYMFLGNFAATARGISDGLGETIAGFARSAGAAYDETLGKQADASAEAAAKAKEAAGIIQGAFKPVADKFAELTAITDGTTDSLSGAAAAAAAIDAGGAGGGGKGGKGAKEKLSEQAKAAQEAAEALKRLQQEHAILQATLGMTETQERAYRAAMDLGTGATDAQRSAVMALVPEMARLEQAQQSMRDRAQQMQQGFRDMFTGIVTGAEKARDAISNLLGKMADMLANRAFDMLWAGFGGSLFGGDALTNALRGAGVGLATGGRIVGDGWAKVGERGPELVRLPQGATVYDANQSRAAMAGGGMTYAPVFHLGGNVTADDLAAVRRESLANYHQMQRTMPGRVAQINRDPLRR